MIEWGLVHIKDRKAMLSIEELGGGSHVKLVMRKVWVQMTKLPSELRDFLSICHWGQFLVSPKMWTHYSLSGITEHDCRCWC
jgi:hypothetical protein